MASYNGYAQIIAYDADTAVFQVMIAEAGLGCPTRGSVIESTIMNPDELGRYIRINYDSGTESILSYSTDLGKATSFLRRLVINAKNPGNPSTKFEILIDADYMIFFYSSDSSNEAGGTLFVLPPNVPGSLANEAAVALFVEGDEEGVPFGFRLVVRNPEGNGQVADSFVGATVNMRFLGIASDAPATRAALINRLNAWMGFTWEGAITQSFRMGPSTITNS